MLNSEIWRNALSGQNDIWLPRFVTGMRTSVLQNGYCRPHAHQVTEIVFHPKGRGQTLLNGQVVPFEEGSAVIYAAGEYHDQRMETDGEDNCVQLALPPKISSKLKTGIYIPHVEELWVVDGLRQLSRSRAQPGECEQRILDLRASALLLALVQAAFANSEYLATSVSERRARKAEQFIQDHFATIVSLREVAEFTEVSHDHLRHLFKEIKGKSLISYLNEVRVARSRMLLMASPLPLKQIAAMCGFKDEYYFSAVFRKLTGFSPGSYRWNAVK